MIAVCRCLPRPLLSLFGRQISTVSDVLGSYQKVPSVSRDAQLMDSPMAAARDEQTEGLGRIGMEALLSNADKASLATPPWSVSLLNQLWSCRVGG